MKNAIVGSFNRRILLSVALLAAILALVAGLSPPPTQANSVVFYLRCDNTHIPEGEGFTALLVRVGTFNRSIFGAAWHTDSGTADASDYVHQDTGIIYGSLADSKDNVIGRYFQTREDRLYEGNETFTVRFSPTNNVYDRNDLYRDEKCPITIVDDEALPAAPANLTATALNGETVRLQWSAPSSGGKINGQNIPVTGYEYRLANLNGPWVPVPGGNVTSMDRRGLLLYAARHEYQVRAVSEVGVSAASNAAGVGPVDVVPQPPANLRAKAVYPDSVELTWEPSPSGGWIDGARQPLRYQYRIENIPTGWREIPGEGVTSYVAPGLSLEDTAYTFQIRAFNAVGHSWTSGDIVPVGPVAFYPAPPTNLAAEVVDQFTVILSWNASEHGGVVNGEELAHTYQYRTNGGEHWWDIPHGAVTSHTINSGLFLASSAYNLEVRGINEYGPGPASNIVELGRGTANTLPEPPAGLSVEAIDATSATLSWTASANGGSLDGVAQTPRYQYRQAVRLEHHAYRPQYSDWTDIPSGATSHIVAGLDLAANAYQFQLRAVNGLGPGVPTGDAALSRLANTRIYMLGFISGPADGSYYREGEVVEAVVEFRQAVSVTGAPQLVLGFDDGERVAGFDRGHGARLVFAYTVQAGDSARDGIAINDNPLRLNGGSIIDDAGNPAALDFTGFGPLSGARVDASGNDADLDTGNAYTVSAAP